MKKTDPSKLWQKPCHVPYLFRLLVRFSNPDGAAPLDGPQGERRLFDVDGKVEYGVGKGACLLCGCGAALLIPQALTQPEHHKATPHDQPCKHHGPQHHTTCRCLPPHHSCASTSTLCSMSSPPPGSQGTSRSPGVVPFNMVVDAP